MLESKLKAKQNGNHRGTFERKSTKVNAVIVLQRAVHFRKLRAFLPWFPWQLLTHNFVIAIMFYVWMVRKNSLAPGHSLTGEVNNLWKAIYLRDSPSFLYYTVFFKRAHYVLCTALKKDALFSNVFLPILCFTVNRRNLWVVPQFLSRKMYFYNYSSCFHEGNKALYLFL